MFHVKQIEDILLSFSAETACNITTYERASQMCFKQKNDKIHDETGPYTNHLNTPRPPAGRHPPDSMTEAAKRGTGRRFAKGKLSPCKSLPFTRQKTVFCKPKGKLSEKPLSDLSTKQNKRNNKTKTINPKQQKTMNNKTLLENLRNIPDFPKKGVTFRDVTTLFSNPECLQIMEDELYDLYKDKGITKIVGIESRGFIMASALAVKLHAGVVLCRKPGKLPCETVQESYTKEYGTDTIEIHKDSITGDDVVLLHDDLLATGGTMKAAYDLVKKFNPKKVYVNFIIELTREGLNGRDNFDKDTEITTLLEV